MMLGVFQAFPNRETSNRGSCLTSGGKRCFDCWLLISRELEFDDILHSLKLTACPLKIGHPRWKPAFQPFPYIPPFCSRGFGVGKSVPKNTEPNRVFGALGIPFSGGNESFVSGFGYRGTDPNDQTLDQFPSRKKGPGVLVVMKLWGKSSPHKKITYIYIYM